VKLGAYELAEQLGRGGTATVFRARSSDGRAVAIKVLRATSPDALARFEREARLLRSFGEDDGFVPVIETGIAQGQPYLVMPLLPGGTLRARLARGPLGVDPSLAIARALARTLARAHAQGIVHRDLKPENVLFASDGRPLVADLGLAKHFSPDAPGISRSVALTKTGAWQGTAGYMPIEQMRDAKSAGPAADVFALGAILHECVSGRPAFPGDTPMEAIAAIEEGSVPPLSGAPSWLARVVARALDRDPAGRFPDAHALARALDAPQPARRNLPVVATVLGVLAVASAFVLLPRPSRSPPQVGAEPRPSAPARPAQAQVPVSSPHVAPVVALGLGRDHLVTGSEDGTAKLWSLATGALERTLDGHVGAVRCLAVSVDGKYVLAGDRKSVKIWNSVEARVEAAIECADPIHVSFATSESGWLENVIVATEAGFVGRWWFRDRLRKDIEPLPMKLPFATSAHYAWLDKTIVMLAAARAGLGLHDMTGQALWTTPTGRRIESLAWEGPRALTGHADGEVNAWKVSLQAGWASPAFKHARPVRAVAITVDGTLGLSGCEDGSARAFALDGSWASELGEKTREPVRALTYVRGTSRVVVARGPRLELWDDVRPGATPSRVWTHSSSVTR
jgi:hypothetical protein